MSDPTTWEEVARTHGRRIYNYAYRLTGNPADAADLSQEVLLRVRTGLERYTPGLFEAWLWRITHNCFVDGYRKQKRRPTVALPEQFDRVAALSSPAPDVVLAHTTLGEEVQDALMGLSADFREAVVLCDVVGMSYDEIAVSIDVPIGTVRSRIHRGRRLLREALA